MNNSDEFKSAAGGNKLGQTLYKNRLFEKSLERKLEEIDRLWLKRERKLDSKKYEFNISRRRSRHEIVTNETSTKQAKMSNVKPKGDTAASNDTDKELKNGGTKQNNKEGQKEKQKENQKEENKEENKKESKESEKMNNKDDIKEMQKENSKDCNKETPNESNSNNQSNNNNCSRGSYLAIFHKNKLEKLDSTLKNLK